MRNYESYFCSVDQAQRRRGKEGEFLEDLETEVERWTIVKLRFWN